MKSNKQKRKELKAARTAKQAKREAAQLETSIPFRPKHRIAVCPEALSERSQRSWDVTSYYEDEYYKCIDCGTESLFSAEEQKEWYEVKKRDIHQRPTRCHPCFMQWSSNRKTKFRMDEALEKLRLAPDSKEAMRDYALSIVEFHKINAKGNLHAAVHILRHLKEEGDEMAYCTEQIQKAILAKEEMMNFVESLKQETIYAFRKSVGKPEELQEALIQCLNRGHEAGIDTIKLWDIIIKGDDCILRQAELPKVDEIVIWEKMILLINGAFYAKCSGDIDLHKGRISRWYENRLMNL